jgi:hypothetical protein
MRCFAKQIREQRRGGVIVKVEPHDFRIRATSSGGTTLNLPPDL